MQVTCWMYSSVIFAKPKAECGSKIEEAENEGNLSKQRIFNLKIRYTTLNRTPIYHWHIALVLQSTSAPFVGNLVIWESLLWCRRESPRHIHFRLLVSHILNAWCKMKKASVLRHFSQPPICLWRLSVIQEAETVEVLWYRLQNVHSQGLFGFCLQWVTENKDESMDVLCFCVAKQQVYFMMSSRD